jgi:hypothetical protein
MKISGHPIGLCPARGQIFTGNILKGLALCAARRHIVAVR